jgi:hypothetical protein
MRFNEIKQHTGRRGQAKGSDKMPKKVKPSASGEQAHPLQGKLVGESLLAEGARIEHLEDLVFRELPPSKGASRALQSLTDLEKGGHQDVTVKWDGCIHPDSVVETNLGKMPIQDVIDTVNESQDQVSVLQFNFESQTAEMLPVLNAVKKHGAKSWVQVELDNGDTLTLTEDHEVFTTNRGWVAAGELTQDDDIKDINK